MKKKLSLVILLLMISTYAFAYGGVTAFASDVPLQIDSYTEVYDLGEGNYRLILQTDTSKSKGNVESVFANGILNPLIAIDEVRAGHSPGEGSVSAQYNELTHSVHWKLDYFAEQNSDLPTFPIVFPINYLIVDFHLLEGVYGDILIFESVNYTVGYEGYDGPWESNFDFWQVAVRSEAPSEKAQISHQFFEDEDRIIPISIVKDYDDYVYLTFSIKNPNNAPLEDVLFELSHKVENLEGVTLSGQVISESSFGPSDSLNIPLLAKEELVLKAGLRLDETDFTLVDADELFTLSSQLTTKFPSSYLLELDEENILNSGSYVQLKTQSQMEDHTVQVPFIKDENYGWTDDTPEDTPYKTNFEYDLKLPQSVSENESQVDFYEDSLQYVKRVYGSVLVYYQDTEGKNLLEAHELIGEVDNEYTTQEKHIDDYELVEVQGEPEGHFSQEEQIVKYIYKKNISKGSVTVKYLDKDDKEIADTVLLTGNVGADYTTEKKSFDDYELVEIQGEPEGSFSQEEQIVKYIYKKNISKGTVTVKYLDKDDKEIADTVLLTGNVGADYTTEKKSIEGYEFVKFEGLSKGYFSESNVLVKYYYKKVEAKETLPSTGMSDKFIRLSLIFFVVGLVLFFSRINTGRSTKA